MAGIDPTITIDEPRTELRFNWDWCDPDTSVHTVVSLPLSASSKQLPRALFLRGFLTGVIYNPFGTVPVGINGGTDWRVSTGTESGDEFVEIVFPFRASNEVPTSHTVEVDSRSSNVDVTAWCNHELELSKLRFSSGTPLLTVIQRRMIVDGYESYKDLLVESEIHDELIRVCNEVGSDWPIEPWDEIKIDRKRRAKLADALQDLLYQPRLDEDSDICWRVEQLYGVLDMSLAEESS